MPTVDPFWPLQRCKDAYIDYTKVKVLEIEEQQQARRYFHGAQLTDEQRKKLRDKGLTPSIQNRIKRKINGIVGVLERFRFDPKAFPRTPAHEQGADLATQAILYEMDQEEFPDLSTQATFHSAVDGYGGVKLGLSESPHGDKDITLEEVDPADYFYDPTAYKLDFSDVRYEGEGKWFTLEDARDQMPDKADLLQGSIGEDEELTSQPDKDRKWFDMDGEGNIRKVRIVELWYKKAGKWYWVVFTGTAKLYQGESPFYDEQGRQMSRYLMWAAMRDQDGDAYGFIRDLKYAQDLLNAWDMGLMYDILSRRLIIVGEAPQNVEEIRREWARKDGVVNIPTGSSVTKDDKTGDIQGAMLARENSEQFIENTGLNPAVLGTGVENQSGRAISLLQQAGMAELGMFISQRKKWRLRVYRAIWMQIQRHWTAQRWIRVTDDENQPQFIAVNAMQVDQATGLPQLVNVLGELDMDIILDEGPDHLNAMLEAHETLTEMARAGAPIPPQLLIKLSSLPAREKREALEMMTPQSSPAQEQAQQIELQQGAATVERTQADARLKQAQAEKTAQDTRIAPDNLRLNQAKVISDATAKARQADSRP